METEGTGSSSQDETGTQSCPEKCFYPTQHTRYFIKLARYDMYRETQTLNMNSKETGSCTGEGGILKLKTKMT